MEEESSTGYSALIRKNIRFKLQEALLRMSCHQRVPSNSLELEASMHPIPSHSHSKKHLLQSLAYLKRQPMSFFLIPGHHCPPELPISLYIECKVQSSWFSFIVECSDSQVKTEPCSATMDNLRIRSAGYMLAYI
jgi:hypothetical protein